MHRNRNTDSRIDAGRKNAAGYIVQQVQDFGISRLLLFIPAMPVLLAILIPDVNVDTYIHHLAVPERILLIHKYPGETASVAGHLPLSAELLYASAVILGADPLPHLINLFPFLAG